MGSDNNHIKGRRKIKVYLRLMISIINLKHISYSHNQFGSYVTPRSFNRQQSRVTYYIYLNVLVFLITG